MARYIDVRYFVPVYVTVDLDAGIAGAIAHVTVDDEDVFRADESAPWLPPCEHVGRTALVRSYEGDGEDVDPDDLSPEDRGLALAIPERDDWPRWTVGF